MKVIKRNGESQIVSFDKVVGHRISNLCKNEPVCDELTLLSSSTSLFSYL